jgi:hypothetical protein
LLVGGNRCGEVAAIRFRRKTGRLSAKTDPVDDSRRGWKWEIARLVDVGADSCRDTMLAGPILAKQSLSCISKLIRHWQEAPVEPPPPVNRD